MRTKALIITASIAIVAFVWFAFKPPSAHPQAPLPQHEYLDAVEEEAEAAGRYYNERYGFSFNRPEGVLVHERMEGPGAVTVVIEDIKNVHGFQIFIVPYDEPSISDERFKMDIPSEIRVQEEKLWLDGVEGVAFISQDAQLGDTRELWLLRAGYLYEITAPLALDQWLNDILLTWRFEP